MLAQNNTLKLNLGEKYMEKGIALQFHLSKKTLMNYIYDFFQVEMVACMNWNTAIEVNR